MWVKHAVMYQVFMLCKLSAVLCNLKLDIDLNDSNILPARAAAETFFLDRALPCFTASSDKVTLQGWNHIRQLTVDNSLKAQPPLIMSPLL